MNTSPTDLNLHHVELFYHVARAGGITAAVRSMPYGIQQPAVSGQVASLEKELGTKLFHRRPFQLTPAGQELYDFCAPFFSGLGKVADQISGRSDRQLRLAAPATILREHLPSCLVMLRETYPDLELQLLDRTRNASIELLEREELDLAFVELSGDPPQGFGCRILREIPLALYLPATCKIPKSGIQGLAKNFPLIRQPATNQLSQLFSNGLAKRNIDWPTKIEVTMLDLVITYVKNGFGIGLGIMQPDTQLPEAIRAYELKDFPPLNIAALWRGKATPMVEMILSYLDQEASDAT